MISIWPNMSELSDNYQEFLERPGFCPPVKSTMPFRGRPPAVLGAGGTGLFRHGVDAWWCDFQRAGHTGMGEDGAKPEPGEMYREFVEAAGSCMPSRKATPMDCITPARSMRGSAPAQREKSG